MRHVCWVLLLALPMGTPHLTAQDERHGHGEAIVPDSSLESPFDIGVRSHTNHLIRIQPTAGTGPSGTMLPADIRKYYGMASTGGSGAIAVVVAYHYRNALSDFNAFASYCGLPKEKSTNATSSSNKVFQVCYATGRQPYQNSGWSQEAALDIEWSHAMAPGAKIYLVEAASAYNSDLLYAVDQASQLPGVTQISMSWGASEFLGEDSNDSHFTKAGICFCAASGDTGGQVNWPSVSVNVVAAGGTTLNTDVNHLFLSETGWSGSGGGVSAYIGQPGWQINTGTTPTSIIGGTSNPDGMRCVPDLSMDADPNTGVFVIWNGGGYWFGGTSVASPSLAGMANLCGVKMDSATFLSHLYTRYFNTPKLYYDPQSGSAGGNSCGAGWDAVTGVGTPRGTTSFVP